MRESSERDLYTDYEFIFNKNAKVTQRGKDSSFNK